MLQCPDRRWLVLSDARSAGRSFHNAWTAAGWSSASDLVAAGWSLKRAFAAALCHLPLDEVKHAQVGGSLLPGNYLKKKNLFIIELHLPL